MASIERIRGDIRGIKKTYGKSETILWALGFTTQLKRQEEARDEIKQLQIYEGQLRDEYIETMIERHHIHEKRKAAAKRLAKTIIANSYNYVISRY